MKIKLTKLVGILSLALCSSAQAADLSGIKNYLLEYIDVQIAGAEQFKQAADEYYDLAKSKNFDYELVAKDPRTLNIIRQARIGWKKAAPAYENVEGIVAGVDQLSEFDNILDAGVPASTGADSASVVPFNLKLPNGKVLEKPGNLYGIAEGALYGTENAFTSNVLFDVNKNYIYDFGEKLPEANVLKAGADKLYSETLRLQSAAKAWQPSESDVFNALIANVPTTGPTFFGDWRTSRFVMGDAATRRDFMATSRLYDLIDNISSWKAMYKGLSPLVEAKNPQLDRQIKDGLNDLTVYVKKLAYREKERRYTPEQAEQLQHEAQDRATAITGKISQAAALLNVAVK